MQDPFDLQRFVDAQADVYEDVHDELHAGRKASHWMWFVFPQIAGLGYSPASRAYAITSLAEARAYLAHPVLGPRLRACVAWGACFDLSDLDTMPPHTRDGFIYVTGIEDRDEATAHLHASIDLADVIDGLRCPTYVVHGYHDRIFTMPQVELLRERVIDAPIEIDVEMDGDHCCHNMGPIVRPRMADWMAQRLAEVPAR